MINRHLRCSNCCSNNSRLSFFLCRTLWTWATCKCSIDVAVVTRRSITILHPSRKHRIRWSVHWSPLRALSEAVRIRRTMKTACRVVADRVLESCSLRLWLLARRGRCLRTCPLRQEAGATWRPQRSTIPKLSINTSYSLILCASSFARRTNSSIYRNRSITIKCLTRKVS